MRVRVRVRVNVTPFGVNNSGTVDVTERLHLAAATAFASRVALLFPPGRYLVWSQTP